MLVEWYEHVVGLMFLYLLNIVSENHSIYRMMLQSMFSISLFSGMNKLINMRRNQIASMGRHEKSGINS
jgi:hypothetical protein